MISPDDTFVRFLDDNASRPDTQKDPRNQDDRPAIIVRYGSSRSWTDFQNKLAALLAEQGTTDVALYAGIEQLLDTVIVGRRNVEQLGDLLTDRQLLQLAHGLRGDAYLAESDRKNSESPSPSVAAASAGTATPEQASA